MLYKWSIFYAETGANFLAGECVNTAYVQFQQEKTLLHKRDDHCIFKFHPRTHFFPESSEQRYNLLKSVDFVCDLTEQLFLGLAWQILVESYCHVVII